MASAFPFKSATGKFLPARSKAPRFKVMFDGKVLGRTFDTKPEAQGVADGLNKTMPGSATVIRANPGKGAFKRCVKAVAAKGKATSPRGVCAAAGRKKYGAKKFQQMAAAGRKAANRPQWDYYVSSGLDDKKQKKFTGATARADAMLYAQQEADSTGWSAFVWRGVPGGMGSARSATVKPSKKKNTSTSSLSAELDAVKHSIIELQDRHDRKPTRESTDRLVKLRAKFMKLSREYMTQSRRGNPPSTSSLSAELDAIKRTIIELQDRFDKMPTFALGESLKKARATYRKLGKQFMAAERRSRPNAKGGTDFTLYDAAKEADDAFQAALVKQYGGRAGDMRYQSAKHPAHIKALAKAKQKADERWLAEMRRGNPKLLTSIGQGSTRADVYALKGGAHQVRMRGEAPKEFGSKDGAMKYARLRVHELAKNPLEGLAAAESMVAGKQSLTAKLLRKLQGKKNPEASAEEMYQIFHGLPAEKVVEYRETIHVHEWLWAVGTLNNMQISDGKQMIVLTAPDPKTNPFEDVVMVCMTEDGKQFHFRGGDQSLPLDGIAEAFGLTEDDVREHMEIGRIRQMTYRTRKVFEDRGQVNIDFYHDLGKEHAQNKLPLLVYKPLNPSMDIVGGRYKVAPLDKSIKASPGVVG